jgi:Holliday junction resolvase
MTTPSKRKGSQYERDVAKWLISYGFPYVERAYGAGRHDDVGDIDGIHGVVIECKNEKRIALSGYLQELSVEMANADVKTGVVLIKKRGTTDVSESYAVMPAWLWADLLKQAGYNRNMVRE